MELKQLVPQFRTLITPDFLLGRAAIGSELTKHVKDFKRSDGEAPESAELQAQTHQLSEEGFQRPSARVVPELEQRFLLDLANALASDPKQRPDILESHRIFAIEPEIQSQDLRLSLFQARE